jgi:tRNA-guanine transglycosylase
MEEVFIIEKKNKYSKARAGVLKLPSGKILETPAYAIVGTYAEIRCLKPQDFPKVKIKLIIANTYHLWRNLGKNINNFPSLSKFMKAKDAVIMTDSGGFQVFSMGFGRITGISKVTNLKDKDKLQNIKNKYTKESLVKITKEGVYFKENKKMYFLGPELSIKIQHKLKGDIILAFDECTSPLHSYEYQKKALQRTHAWAKRSLEEHFRLLKKENPKERQLIYGIIQGGIYEDLRKKSSQYILQLPFDGYAIGGSFGEKEMRKIIRFSLFYLPENKPRHLLGIGRIENILDAVEEGIDTFDCVIPTREARHGGIWTMKGRFNVKKAENKKSKKVLERGCKCPTCESGIKRGDLYEMFHSKDKKAGEYATIHNVYFFNSFMEKVRDAIKNNKWKEFRNEVKKELKNN